MGGPRRLKVFVRVSFASILVAACSRTPHDATTAPTDGSTSAAPSGPSTQSSVPPEGSCTTPPGKVVQVYSGNVVAFAVDADYVYVNDAVSGMARVPVVGGAPRRLGGTDGGVDIGPRFALGGGAALVPTRALGLDRIPADNDPMSASYSAGVDIGGFAFDGLAIYVSHFVMAEQSALARIPVDGSAATLANFPMGLMSGAMVPGPDGIYVAMSNASGQGSIVKMPPGADPIVLLGDINYLTGLAVDDSYVYFSDMTGPATSGGVRRMALDGSGLVTLTSPAGGELVADAHALYFVRGNAVMKMDKTGGTPAMVASLIVDQRPIAPDGLVVYGGNVYWSAYTATTDSGITVYVGGVWTTCK
jgi:hypothetical protein